MKKVLLLLLAALMITFIVTACSPQEDAQNDANDKTAEPSVIVLPKDNF